MQFGQITVLIHNVPDGCNVGAFLIAQFVAVGFKLRFDAFEFSGFFTGKFLFQLQAAQLIAAVEQFLPGQVSFKGDLNSSGTGLRVNYQIAVEGTAGELCLGLTPVNVGRLQGPNFFAEIRE